MKIFIPFHVRDIGGPSTFARKFKEGMERRGHQVVFEEPADYDILLLIVQAPLRILMRAKKKKKVIVQRLDGVYYWSVASWKYPFLNLKALLIRHWFADFTIYQSKYSRKSANRFLGKKRNERYRIIYNGVDTNIFSPEGEQLKDLRDYPEQKIFFTVSDFRRKDQIQPILDALESYGSKYHHKWKFVIAGAFRGELTGFHKKLEVCPNIQYIGKIDNAGLPRYERAADVFLFTHLNPPCPNNVLEAMACGLPICGIADGAMPELVRQGENGYLLMTRGEAYWKKRSYDPENFSENITRILSQKDQFSKASRSLAIKQYSLENMIGNYEQVLISFLK